MIPSKYINIINQLIPMALISAIEHRLAAGIIKSGKLIDKPKCNSPRNIYHGANFGSLHAEARAILNYYGKDLQFDKKKGWYLDKNSKINGKLNLIVIRVDRCNNICNARPCYHCLNMMKAVGINKVYYTMSNHEIICEKVKDMISIHSSSVTRFLEGIKGNKNANDDILYYSSLIKSSLPINIRKNNVEFFIKYNLLFIPQIKYHISQSKLILLTPNDSIIKEAFII